MPLFPGERGTASASVSRKQGSAKVRFHGCMNLLPRLEAGSRNGGIELFPNPVHTFFGVIDFSRLELSRGAGGDAAGFVLKFYVVHVRNFIQPLQNLLQLRVSSACCVRSMNGLPRHP